MATVVENNGDASSDTGTQYTVSLGDVFQGTLDPAADTDWIRVELSTETIYEITLTGDKSTHLIIQNPENEIIYQSRYQSSDKKMIFNPIDTGTYYLSVRNTDKDYSGDYQISLKENTIPVGTYDEIAHYMTDGNYESFGSRRRAFNVEPGGVLTANITNLTEAGQQYARWALEAWTYVTGIDFELVDHDYADISFDDTQQTNYAIVQRLFGVINSAFVNVSVGNRDVTASMDSHIISTYIHEIGHALGLAHPGPEPYGLNYGFDNIFLIDSDQITVMSYFSQFRNTYINASEANPITPMIADILAIHDLYGVPTDINAGDTIYGYKSNTKSYLDAFFEQWTAGILQRAVTLTLYDTSGNDTLDLRTDIYDQRVDLHPEGISDIYGWLGNLVIARDTLIENYIAGSGNDHVIGNAAGNTLRGGEGNDVLQGNEGDDVLEGGAGADRLEGGSGMDWVSYQSSDSAVTVSLENNTLEGGHAQGDILVDIEGVRGSAYADALTGDSGANFLDGYDGDDELWGNGGDDVLEGGAGADRLDGGDGLDWVSYLNSDTAITVNLEDGTLDGSHTQGDVYINIEYVRGSGYGDTLVGDGGANRLDGAGGDDELWGNSGDDILEGNAGKDRLYGDDGDDELQGGSGDDVLEGGAGADQLDGGDGIDWVSYQGSDGAVSVRLYDGYAGRGHAEGDTITGVENLRGSAHPDRLAGTGRANHLEGGAGNDQIRGGSGDDVLEGGAGADRLYGGNGADTASYTGSDAGVVVRLHNLSARGGHAEGDTFENTLSVTYTDTDGSSQTESLPDIENLTGSDHNDILAGDRRGNILYGAAGDDILYGGPGGGDDLMDGGPGADKLYGGQGDDRLTGGAGADQLRGGAGQDWVSYEGSDSAVTVKLLEGVVEGGHAQGDLVIDIESVIGSDYSDILGGNNNANNLYGRAGDDELRGGNGDDILDGGAGADRLYGGSGIDILSYQSSQAGVSVNLMDNTLSGGYAEGDVIDGFENVEGSGYQDVLIGNDNNNHLDGKDSDDELRGNGGDDMLYGGDGDDHLDGGIGADHLYGGSGMDWISYQESNAGVVVSLADDMVEGGHAQGDIITEIENVIGTIYGDILDGNDDDNQLIGSDGDDELRGNAGNDRLDGGAGTDRLYGGDGDDELRGGADNDVLNGGAGMDWVSYQGSDERVWVDLDSGTARYGHAEGDVINDIENIRGSNHNDLLKGDEGSNHLSGHGGHDEFWSSDGNDIVDGGSGHDALFYESSPAAVTVNLEVGTGKGGQAEGDIILEIEEVTGSDYNDILIGNDDRNRLNGGDGDDEIQGNGGNDLLYGGDGADKLWGGNAADFMSGEDGADQLFGGAAADGFLGGEGADWLDGGEGTDYITYANSPSGITINLREGTGSGGHAEGDTIINIEDVTGSDYGDILIGNDGDNEMMGLNGDDELHGNGGEDYLRGREGADKLWGGDGDDILNGGDGADQIDGGNGTDLLTYWNSDTGVTVNFKEATASGGHAEGDIITGIERVGGSQYDDLLIGDVGDDRLDGFFGDDTVHGDDGDDVLQGGFGSDKLYGDNGDDILSGDQDNDYLYGGKGNDRLYGDNGDDQLYGDAGADLLLGGTGNDIFVIGPGGGDDIISDFNDNEDRIDLTAFDLTDFDDLTLTAVPARRSVIVDMSAYDGGTIYLSGVDIADLDATDFLF